MVSRLGNIGFLLSPNEKCEQRNNKKTAFLIFHLKHRDHFERFALFILRDLLFFISKISLISHR